MFDPSLAWSLSPQVSLRAESFGALAYHHVNRRLVFLKSKELVELVGCLERFESADVAIDSIVDERDHATYVKALASLAASEIISVR
ncbi:MAG: mycofactocin biosynthesis chaperone MftB [Acidimicrobiales bacterium]